MSNKQIASEVLRRYSSSIYKILKLKRDPFWRSLLSRDSRIRRKLKRLSPSERKTLFSICSRILRHELIGRKNNLLICITVLEIIVSDMTRSTPIVRKLLENKSRRADYKIHCILFMVLDDFIELKISTQVRREILSCLSDYLYDIQRNNATAAWKAGESLGFHWPLKESFPVLADLAKHARYAAGRDAAITGFCEALIRKGTKTGYKKKILSLLPEIQQSDRSQEVRCATEFVLGLAQKRAKSKKGK